MNNINRFDTVSLMTAENGNSCNNYALIRPYIRDNHIVRESYERPYYMIDSTYTVASDPNSMRDTGPTRNARYVLNDSIE